MATISKIKATADNVDYNIRDDYSIWGGRNFLPITQAYLYTRSGKSATSQGITVTQEENGWFSVSGTKTSTSGGSICLWPNPTGNNTDAAINDNFVDINLNGPIIMKIEVEGTPFLSGSAYSDSTHIVMYGPSSSSSWRLGGYTSSLQKTGTFAQSFFSVVRYYIGASSSGSPNGRFRIKIEKGNKPTDWSPAPEDIAKFIGDETIELYSE